MKHNEQIVINERITLRRRGKKGIWAAEYYANGHRRRSMRTSNARLAEQEARKLAEQLALFGGDAPVAKKSLEEAIGLFIAHKQSDRAPKTVTRYRGQLNKFLLFCRSHNVRYLDRVTALLVDQFRQIRAKECDPVTLHLDIAVIKNAFCWFRQRRLLLVNQLQDYQNPKPKPREKPTPTLEQVNLILAQCTPAKAAQIAMLAFTGMRVGSLKAQQRSWITPDASWLSYCDQKKRGENINDFPVHPRLAEIIRPLLKGSHDLLFTAEPSVRYPEGGRPINEKKLNEYFKAAAARAGLKGFTLHSLRHFFKSFCINNGVPDRAVDVWLNHSDSSVRARYYHLQKAESRGFMDAVPFGKETVTDDTASKSGKEF